MIRLMIVDDHEPTREEACKTLAQSGMVEVICQAETSDEAWKLAQQLLPDIVLLDLHLPGLITTMDLIKRLTGLKNCKVVMYASQGKASEVQDLLEAGACGYVLKSDAPALIRMAFIMVSRGSKSVISPSLPRHLTRLSFQERNILRHITKRGGIAKASERLGIDEGEFHEALLHLAEKLEIEDVDELAKWAKKHDF